MSVCSPTVSNAAVCICALVVFRCRTHFSRSGVWLTVSIFFSIPFANAPLLCVKSWAKTKQKKYSKRKVKRWRQPTQKCRPDILCKRETKRKNVSKIIKTKKTNTTKNTRKSRRCLSVCVCVRSTKTQRFAAEKAANTANCAVSAPETLVLYSKNVAYFLAHGELYQIKAYWQIWIIFVLLNNYKTFKN